MKYKSFAAFAAVLFSASIFQVQAKITLPAFFADNMVLQRQTDARLWGEAVPGKIVSVIPGWDGKCYRTTADDTGRWALTVPTPDAGGPYDIAFSDGEALTLHNVLIGEVWLCSGQSNMEMPMKGFKNQPVDGANEATLHSRNSLIRLFTVKRTSTVQPQHDVVGKWQEAAPLSVREFSATAYFFGRQIQEILGIPVGLIVAAWGGSACEAWMNKEMLRAFPEVKIPCTQEDIKSPNRTPTVLFNGMLSPLIGFSIRGVIWYQGEDNWNRAHSYAQMFSTMIGGWRTLWKQGDFPFYYCQIAPYDYALITANGAPIYNSAYLREAQAEVEKMTPNTGMAVLMDAGFREGIHPSDKRTAGERLALLALGKTYGITGITCESPRYQSMIIQGDTAVLSFERAPMWICGKRSFRSTQFKVAGADRVFHPADAWIARSKVYVRSDRVAHPVAVRYAFENYADGDLFGGDGLPLSSFRTDDWPDSCPIKQ